MARGKGRQRRQNKQQRKRLRYPLRRTSLARPNPAISWLSFARTLITSLPVNNASKTFFDILFNVIELTVGSITVKAGAYSAFQVTPGCLMKYSPYLAKDSNGTFTFPGHPIRVLDLRVKILPVTKMSERQGKWAAVFIPYKELHDAKSYQTVQKMDFTEVSAMPYAVSNLANKNLFLTYKFRNPYDYCSRPRELNEAIGLIFIVWDASSRNDNTSDLDGGLFGCEIEIYGTCKPYPIFSSIHRVAYESKVFEPIASPPQIRNYNVDTGIMTFRDVTFTDENSGDEEMGDFEQIQIRSAT